MTVVLHSNQVSWGALSSAPSSAAQIASIVHGARQDEYQHLLLEWLDNQIFVLESSRFDTPAFLIGDALFLSETELEMQIGFLEFTGMQRALLEIRVTTNDLLELRVLEW